MNHLDEEELRGLREAFQRLSERNEDTRRKLAKVEWENARLKDILRDKSYDPDEEQMDLGTPLKEKENSVRFILEDNDEETNKKAT